MAIGNNREVTETIDQLKKDIVMAQDRDTQAILERDPRPEPEFDQWAKAVRQQMVAALKRRGNS
jgi:hypothetical protein